MRRPGARTGALKILLIHNRYRYRGGEDVVVEQEREMLRARGHRVGLVLLDSRTIRGMGRLSLFLQSVWSRRAYRAVGEVINRDRPDLVHIHNLFPLVSPSVYDACRAGGVPVVQSLHNYRLLCPNAILFRGGRTCVSCLGRKFAFPGILHGCYHGSRTQTAAVALGSGIHNVLGTWRRKVDHYIVLTNFARGIYLGSGIPAGKISVKPNFVPDGPGVRSGAGSGFLFVGRLSGEKGVAVLLQAYAGLADVPFTVVGDGPLKRAVASCAARERWENFSSPGALPRPLVMKAFSRARALVVPSICFEGFPMVIAEAFSRGVPVIASRLGGMAEIVRNGRTGLFFRPGDSGDLARKIRWAWEHPGELREMGRGARREYDLKYTADKNYETLMGIYRKAIDANRADG